MRSCAQSFRKSSHAVKFLILVYFLLLALALDGDHPLIESYVNVFFLDRRQLRPNEVFLVRLANVRRRRPLEFIAAVGLEAEPRPTR